MTRTSKATLAMLLALFSHGAWSDDGADDAVRAQVAAATAEWIATFNTRDATRIAALYAPDAILWGTVSSTIRTTPQAILEYFEESSARRPNLRMVLGEYHVRLYGDLATNSGYYASRNPVDDKEVVVPMRFTFIYRKQDDRWMIVNHHSSRFATP
ncbi:MAG: SgcJ/EcaC family oxidoreductase [Burkholderiales bacterium]